MTRSVALLRGINVGGHAKIAMKDLRQLFLDLGHADVETYVQSGNVVFTPCEGDASRLTHDIEARIEKDLGLTVSVLVRSRDELTQVVSGNPFLKPSVELTQLYVSFLAEAPDPDQVARLDPAFAAPDEFALVGREIYLHCPGGYGRSKLNNTYFERRLRAVATTRNWNSVTRLSALANG